MSEPFVVQIPPLVAPLAGKFLATMRRYGVNLRESMARGDFQSVAGLAHQIKGTGGTFGFRPVSEIGARIEESANNRDPARVMDAISELEEFVRFVRVPGKGESQI